jgi:uncharacterized protein
MPHVSLITLGVDDLTLMTTFYEELGWRRSSASVEGVVSFLQGDNVALALFGSDDLAADAGLDGGSGAESRAGHGAVALATNLADEAAVDGFLATADAAGGRITKPAERAEWGGYSGYFTDPEGHLWEVAFNPGFPLKKDGQVTLPP